MRKTGQTLRARLHALRATTGAAALTAGVWLEAAAQQVGDLPGGPAEIGRAHG